MYLFINMLLLLNLRILTKKNDERLKQGNSASKTDIDEFMKKTDFDEKL